MSRLFEELDFRPTSIGALSLRRRLELKTGEQIYEIKLGEEFLMSSMFTASEKALATLALAKIPGDKLQLIVGGLGLGYTAQAVLADPRIASLQVIDKLPEIIEWHQSGLLPLGKELSEDPRCEFLEGDFFALAMAENGFGRKLDGILVDIDHSPEFYLDAANASFYGAEGLGKLAEQLKPGGIFGLWSDDSPDDNFAELLSQIFEPVWAEPVTFHNPLQNKNFTQSVYLGQKLAP